MAKKKANPGRHFDTVHECLKCGFCCRKAPCPFGRWDQEKKQCAYITEENLCGR